MDDERQPTELDELTRRESLSGRLARVGFLEVDRAHALLAGDRAARFASAVGGAERLVETLGGAADPDRALLGLVRLLDALAGLGGAEAGPAGLGRAWATEEGLRARLTAVLGCSVALTDHLVRHPDRWRVLGPAPDAGAGWPDAAALRADLLESVGAEPDDDHPVAAVAGDAGAAALRDRYRTHVLALAARDLTDARPTDLLPRVCEQLADLAGAALEAALAVARAELAPPAPGAGGAEPCRLAVIGMGKCGARELNYVSDVDVIFITADGDDPALATRLARRTCALIAGPGSEPPLWEVDTALRPDGKSGPLVRSLGSARSYYDRWADPWEFQALLKARPIAGDAGVGAAFVGLAADRVWQIAGRPGFVEGVQAMRARVVAGIPAGQADRQVKLGVGGLRDIEFTVQLLQLVHGRGDTALRQADTLGALGALAAGSYIGRDAAHRLDQAYRWLRVVEHRLQLPGLRRTHLLPDRPDELRRLGRACAPVLGDSTALDLLTAWRATRRRVRALHERIFYGPLLAAASRLSTEEAMLSPEAAEARLAAIGYRDPAGALRHIQALVSGLSRRAATQRRLLPVLLGWFAAGTDPDRGLLAFRRISEALGATPWYLRMLRDSEVAARRLARVLSSSRLATDLLEGSPEAAQWFTDDAGLRPRSRARLAGEMAAAADRHEGPGAAADAVLAIRSREVLRAAIAQIVGVADLETVARILTDATVAAIDAVLEVAVHTVSTPREASGQGTPFPARLLVVGMGRLGGGELGFGSDADVLYAFEPVPGASEAVAAQAATAVVTLLQQLLARPGRGARLDVDAALRPEGRRGPLVRSLDALRAYYAQWAEPWEAQALLRATPMAGHAGVAARFREIVDPVRYPEELPADAVRQIRRLKARMESERLPRGTDPALHVKLGRGGLSDVEWTVQLLQLRHAARLPTLRTASTLGALAAAQDAGVVSADDAATLAEAWRLAGRVRNALAQWRGRASDVLPVGALDADAVARLLGYPPHRGAELENDYRRVTRRARAVVERLFYA